MRRIHVLVSGEVQGVGFRYTARLIAREQGARGWIRNLSDGRVEAEVEGTGTVVEAVVAWMRQGPPGSHVTHVDVDERDPTGGDDPFEVQSPP